MVSNRVWKIVFVFAYILPFLLAVYSKMFGEEIGLLIAVIIYPLFNVIIATIITFLYTVTKKDLFKTVILFSEIGMLLTYSTNIFINNIIGDSKNYILKYLAPIASIPSQILNTDSFISEYFFIMFLSIISGILVHYIRSEAA